MNPRQGRARLQGLTSTLLDPHAPSGALEHSAAALHTLCMSLAEVEATDPCDEPLQLPNGLALGPLSAARCTLDATRTARFLQGVRAAIDLALSRCGEPVRVLYAGCGPLAPLALPLTTLLSPEQVRFTLLDVHAFATDHLQRLIRALGVQAWIERLETADALAWQVPQPPHVIVVECLQQALTREPQVALMRHLAPQLAPEGLFVPQRIRLRASLADLRRELRAQFDEQPLIEDAPAYVELGTILDVRAAALQRREPLCGSVQLSVPIYDGAERHLLVRTHIQVFDETTLADADSGITQPLVMHALGHVAPGTRLEFNYETGRDPGPRCRILR